MSRPGEYTHRGVATSFEAQDVKFWDSGDDHGVTLVCTSDLSADASLDVASLLKWNWASGTYSSTEYVSMLPASVTSNVVAVIGGKGLGGIQADVADGTSTGGNNRGNSAVDLQQTRTTATQVASGTGSIIPGGADNTCSGAYTIAIGEGNTSSGAYATTLGRDCVADAAYGHARGYESDTHNRYGSDVFASGKISAVGDCQVGKMILRGTSSSTTPITLTSDSLTASTTNQLTLQTDSVVNFQGLVVAYNTSSNQIATYTIEGTIKRPAAAAGTVLLTSTVTTQYENVTGLDVTLTADTTNGGLQVSFTGQASNTYNVACVLGWVEIL